MVKTNVMRLLDAAGISYEPGTYEVDENDLSGSHAADLMGVDHDQMYKTLVLKGDKKGYLVCCIPVDEELDLKKAAKAAGDKKVEMIHVKDMLGITEGQTPKFVKAFAQVGQQMMEAFQAYDSQVKSGAFPAPAQTYAKSDCGDEVLNRLDESQSAPLLSVCSTQ